MEAKTIEFLESLPQTIQKIKEGDQNRMVVRFVN